MVQFNMSNAEIEEFCEALVLDYIKKHNAPKDYIDIRGLMTDYANLRLDFMKKHRRGTYTTLLTEGRLNEYLHAIDIRAHELLDDIIPRLAQERGINEDLKAHNALQWVAEMNNIKASAEEVVLREVVYQ